MSTQITLAELIKLSNAPGVERVLAHDDFHGCEVCIHNGIVTTYPVSIETWVAFQEHIEIADDWKFTLSMSHRGFMGQPVMTEAETLVAQARWEARHDPEEYGLEARW
jgi:hypothetical protein